MTSTIKQRLICSPLLHLAVPTTGGDSGIAGTSDSTGFFIQNEGLANASMLGIESGGTTKKRRIGVNGDVTSLSLEYWLDGNSLPGSGLPGSNRCLGLCKWYVKLKYGYWYFPHSRQNPVCQKNCCNL